MFRAWLELARISNLPTVWTNVTAAWLLAGGPWREAALGWLVLAGSLLYTGGMILNDAADLKFDREHRKERAIPSGRVSLASAWVVGLGMLIGGGLLAWLQTPASPWLILALVSAILAYDLYHKPWPGAVWVMGACRVFLFLMAASAATGSSQVAGSSLHQMPEGVWLAALALGAYIVGLTMVARLESKKGSVSPLHSLFAKTLLCSPGLLATVFWLRHGNWKLISILGDLSPLVPGVLILAFFGTVFLAIRWMKQGGPAIGRAVGILLAGIAVVDALAVMQVSLKLACIFALMAPVLRLWQRWIAAT